MRSLSPTILWHWNFHDNYHLQLLSAFCLSSHFAMFHIIGKISTSLFTRPHHLYLLVSSSQSQSLKQPVTAARRWLPLSLSPIVDCWLHPALIPSSWHITGWFVCSFSSAWQVDSTILTCRPITYRWLLDSANQSPSPSCPSHRRSTISHLSLFLPSAIRPPSPHHDTPFSPIFKFRGQQARSFLPHFIDASGAEASMDNSNYIG